MTEIERSKNTKIELPSLTGEPSLSFKNGLLLFIYLPIYVPGNGFFKRSSFFLRVKAHEERTKFFP